jgi:rubrerythrin
VTAASSSPDAPIRLRDVTGTSYAMWRCATCGETGRLRRQFPAGCQTCGAPREYLFYLAED